MKQRVQLRFSEKTMERLDKLSSAYGFSRTAVVEVAIQRLEVAYDREHMSLAANVQKIANEVLSAHDRRRHHGRQG